MTAAMIEWLVLLGLLAAFLALSMLRRRMLEAPGEHLGRGTHAFDGDDAAAAPVAAVDDEPRG